MARAFEKKLFSVRLRCSANLLLEQSAYVLGFAGLVAVAAVLLERLFALSIVSPVVLRSFAAIIIGLIILLWLVNQPSRMQVSLLLDERLKIHERFSTTLALADSQDPFARAARAEARETARLIDTRAQFPVRPSRRWFYVIGTWPVVLALVLFMPQKDLLGFLKKRQRQKEQSQQVQLAKENVNDAAGRVKSALKQLGNPELAEDLKGLEQLPKQAKPEDIKRQAIRKLGDISDRLKKMQSDVKLQSVDMIRQMFKQLPGSPQQFSQQLRLALAKGNFAQASNILNQMQKQLLEGKIPDEQKKQLSQQLQKLAQQLRQLAAKNEQFEKELQKQGLDKALAKLDEKQLRQILQKKGLSAEKIEQLLQKAAVCQMASSRCSGLGQAMAACGAGAGGLGADQLSAVTEQLDELEALQQQLMMTQAALDQVGRACCGLGKGMCKGLGGRGPFETGAAKGFGSGTGGPGRGYGSRGYDDTGQSSTKRTKVKNKTSQGPVIASWYFKGTQIKGQARHDFSRVLQAARDGAAEAIKQDQIPRKYQDSVKKYFGQLEESGRK